MRMEPWACLASRPVSKVSGWPLIVTDSRTKDMRVALLGATPRSCGSTPDRSVRLVSSVHAHERVRARAGESKSKVKGAEPDGNEKGDGVIAVPFESLICGG